MEEETWICVQRKTFTAWVNAVLSESDSGVKVQNLEVDISLALEPVLHNLAKSRRIPPPTKRDRVHLMDYMASVFKLLREVGLNTDDISPEDVVDQKSKLILALVWRLIQKYSIFEKKEN